MLSKWHWAKNSHLNQQEQDWLHNCPKVLTVLLMIPFIFKYHLFVIFQGDFMVWNILGMISYCQQEENKETLTTFKFSNGAKFFLWPIIKKIVSFVQLLNYSYFCLWSKSSNYYATAVFQAKVLGGLKPRILQWKLVAAFTIEWLQFYHNNLRLFLLSGFHIILFCLDKY